MADVSSGAAAQVLQLQSVDGELKSLKGTAASVKSGADDVAALACDVEASAVQKRQEIRRALEMLLLVRQDVSRDLAELLLADFRDAVGHFDKHPVSVPLDATEASGFSHL